MLVRAAGIEGAARFRGQSFCIDRPASPPRPGPLPIVKPSAELLPLMLVRAAGIEGAARFRGQSFSIGRPASPPRPRPLPIVSPSAV